MNWTKPYYGVTHTPTIAHRHGTVTNYGKFADWFVFCWSTCRVVEEGTILGKDCVVKACRHVEKLIGLKTQ